VRYTSKQPFFTVKGPHRGKQTLGRHVLSWRVVEKIARMFQARHHGFEPKSIFFE
jgi:hypothetical protein